MNTWKQYGINALYLHHRLIVMVIVAIGGCVALWVVYLFLFTNAPVEQVKEQVSDVPINQEALERATLWNKKKQEQGATTIIVPSSAFRIPSSAP